MSRRRRPAESSLELLLDTICNTFGGILFVALLIIVMLRVTAKTAANVPVEVPTEVERLELARQQEELQATLSALSKAIAAVSEIPLPVEAVGAELAKDLRAQQKLRHELMEQRLKSLNSIAELTQEIDQTNREIEELAEREKSLEERREKVQTELKQAVAKRTQQVEYSELRPSFKQEIGIVLRYGRLYVWHRYGPGGTKEGLNTDEFVVLEESAAQVRCTPNPVAGTPIDESGESRQAIERRLKAFSPSRQVIAVIVWLDTFGHFRHVKEAIVRLGFNYRLIPVTNDGNVADRGGSSSGVQ
jgi:TolA-binding protein